MSSDDTPAQRGLSANDWAGEAGTRWLAQLDRFERMIAPIGEALLAQAAYAPGESVVDVGCGGGWTSRQIARAVAAQGLVVGLDISAVLIATATERARAAGLANLRFEQADAARAMPQDAPFDRLFSRFGTMFFPEPYPAFANLHRMLRPGGRLDLAVWAPLADNPWTRRVLEVIAAHIPLPPPQPRAPGPFALGEPDYLRDLLQSAGFTDIALEAWTGLQRIGGLGSDPASAARFVLEGMHVGDLVRASPPDTQAFIERDLVALFERHCDAQGVGLEAKAWLVRARA